MFRRRLKKRQHRSLDLRYPNQQRPGRQMDLRHSCSYQEVMRTRPVSCDLTYLIDVTISSYNSWPMTMFGNNHKLRAQKRYRTVGIGSSAAYCGGKNAEVVIAALNRGGSVRPACAYWHGSAAMETEKDKDKPRHAAAQSRLLSSRLISALDMSTCNPDTPAAQCRSDIM